jgi:hypothetical protein
MAVTRIRRYVSLIAVGAAALALPGASPASAQFRPDGPVILFSSFPGVADGQKVVATVFNSEPEPFEFLLRALGEDGSELARSESIEVPAGQFRSVALHRADLPVAGERGTGRVQAEMTIWLINRRDRYLRSPLPASIEVVDSATGRTQVADVRDLDTISDAEPPAADAFSSLIGLARGDVLEITQRNPVPAGSPGETHVFTVTITTETGMQLATSPEVSIPPGGFRTFRFNRDDLPIAGDPGTGRAQVRTVPLWIVPTPLHLLESPTLSIIDANTGQTRVSHRGPAATLVDLTGRPGGKP